MTNVTLAASVLALATVACTTTTGTLNVLDAKTDKAHPATYLGLPLRSGQLVITEAPGAYSFVFALIPEHYHPFTHAAIISMEDGLPYVYDISGRYKPTFHSRVLDNVKGGMRRTPFDQYVAPNLYAEVYDLPDGIDPARAVAFAKQKFAEGVEFDAFFDNRSHDKLFCTELVQLELIAGGAKPVPMDTVRANPSLKLAMQWLGVPLGEALPPIFFVDQKNYVGSLGQFSSRTAAYSYFEGKRELHRRFQKNQRLGFLFVLHGSGDISARPEIDDFMVKATHVFDGVSDPPPPGDERITKEVRRLADATFGPLAD